MTNRHWGRNCAGFALGAAPTASAGPVVSKIRDDSSTSGAPRGGKQVGPDRSGSLVGASAVAWLPPIIGRSVAFFQVLRLFTNW